MKDFFILIFYLSSLGFSDLLEKKKFKKSHNTTAKENLPFPFLDKVTPFFPTAQRENESKIS